MKNRRKIFQRAAALLCCILLLPSLVVVPAHAATEDDQFFDVLAFSTANGSGSQLVSGNLPMSVVFESTAEPFFYVDMIVTTNFNISMVTYAGIPLEVLLINDSTGLTYRVFGDLVGDHSGYLTFTFSGDLIYGADQGVVIFEQLLVSSTNYRTKYTPTIGGIMSQNSGYEDDFLFMPSPRSGVDLYLDYNSNASHYYPYSGYVYVPDWQKYDYIDIFLDFFTTTIDSLGAVLITDEGNISIPYTVSYISSHFDSNNSFLPDVSIPSEYQRYVIVRLDLTNVDRSVGDPMVYFTGTYEAIYGIDRISLVSVTGLVYGTTPSELGTFWQRLQGLLVALFGSGSPAANESQQTQQEIDTEVNLQIVNAMADWEANIEPVSVGFDSYFLSTQPSLIWLGGLADRIFNNMGWFKNVFFTLGLFSICMLILSKAGVAHSVGKYLRR